jgi:hypothetical protein
VQLALKCLHPLERVVVAQRSRLEIGVLAEELGRADECDALRLRPPFRRGDLFGHRWLVGIAEQDEDSVEAAGDDLAANQLVDCADAVSMLAQMEDLACRDQPFPRSVFCSLTCGTLAMDPGGALTCGCFSPRDRPSSW